MARAVFIGDELTGAGYRLAGLEVRTPDSARIAEEVAQALTEGPPLLLITAEYARALGQRALDELLVRSAPLVLLVADARTGAGGPDLAARIRRQLGVR